MPRFLFHLHERGSIVVDDEGLFLPDLLSAIATAIQNARDMVSADAKLGQIHLGAHIEIENTKTGERTVVEFGQAVQLIP